MQTSKQWWDGIKNDEAKLLDWLEKQYRGEVAAAKRITDVILNYDMTEKARKVLTVISSQEAKHADWVYDLLKARGLIVPSVANAEDRYWAQVKDAMEDFETICAVGAHAEAMRLERINVIVDDPDAPEDIRNVFYLIKQEEEFHARAFAELAGADAIAKTKGQHEKGLTILGLVI